MLYDRHERIRVDREARVDPKVKGIAVGVAWFVLGGGAASMSSIFMVFMHFLNAFDLILKHQPIKMLSQ